MTINLKVFTSGLSLILLLLSGLILLHTEIEENKRFENDALCLAISGLGLGFFTLFSPTKSD